MGTTLGIDPGMKGGWAMLEDGSREQVVSHRDRKKGRIGEIWPDMVSLDRPRGR